MGVFPTPDAEASHAERDAMRESRGSEPTIDAGEAAPPPPGAARRVVGYRELFDATPDGIVVVDAEGCIRDANPAVEELFGYDREELIGSDVEELVPVRAREAHRRHRDGYLEAPHRRPMGIGMELRGRRRDGSEFPVEISLSPLEEEGRRYVIATVRDVSERTRLRKFGMGSLRAAEAERRRIARELHDDAAQRLSSLLIRLRLARMEDDPERRDALLEEVREELVDSAELVRRIARGLRPPALEDVGLATAIRSHVRSHVHHAEFEVELDVRPVGESLGEEERLVIYRIVQEALSNVIRHADADLVQVALARRDGRIVAEVRDDGRGFDPERAGDAGGGLGLVGMRERASLIGAEFEIHSVPERGTHVRIAIPDPTEETSDG